MGNKISVGELGLSDKKRLDWLEQNINFRLNFHKKRWSCTRPVSSEYNTYKTMREAIDAAMNGTWQDSNYREYNQNVL